jgi:heat shock protein HslJ
VSRRSPRVPTLALLVIGAAVAFASCRESITALPAVAGGPVWELRSLQVAGNARVDLSEPRAFNVEFAVDGRVSARADCNTCSGSYTVTGRYLVIGPLGCTRVACQTAPLDTQYVQILAGGSTLEAELDKLTLRSERGTLRFER